VPELSADVKNLLAGAKALYEAFKRSKPTQALAIAIRDDVAFEKLQDPELLVICTFYKEIEKLAKVAPAQAAVTGEIVKNGAGEGVKPDAVEPPKGKRADKTKGGNGGDSAT
jgi:hypothetical protein